MTLDQNTKDWHRWRKQGLGASDLPVIMGDSPYRTPYELWLEKTSPVKTEDEPNFVQQKGHELEVIGRNKYEIKTGITFKPAVIEREDMPHFRASLDGFNQEKNIIWECKYAGADVFNDVEKKRLPQKYKAQIHWQLFVSGAKENHFFVINDDHEYKVLIVKPDIKYIEKLVEEAQYFWSLVKSKTPPPFTDKDKIELKEGEVYENLLKYRRYENTIKTMSEELKELKKEIFKDLPHTNCFLKTNEFKISIQKQSRKGTIDWKKLCENMKIDNETQEQFRKKSSITQVIRISDVKN